MTLAAIGSNSRALWYLTRGFGIVAVILLTVTTVLGLAQVARYVRPGLPRFVISALHKNISLISLVAIAIHVITAVADTYAPITVANVFIPLSSTYRPLWTGLGALALDLMLAVIVTSLLRERMGYRTWKTVHWAAYASWPVAVMHGLGTGTDSKLGWVLFLYVACTVAVVAALWWRLAKNWSGEHAPVRGVALGASVMIPILVAVWTATGPLHAGWARRAGTPASLLASGRTAPRSAPPANSGAAAGGSTSSGGASSSSATSALALPFSTEFSGSQRQTGPDSEGLVSVVIEGTFTSGATGSLRLVLTGQPAGGGGVELTGSQFQFGPGGNPAEFQGHVTSLDGATVVATVQDAAGRSAQAVLRLSLSGGATVGGSLRVQE